VPPAPAPPSDDSVIAGPCERPQWVSKNSVARQVEQWISLGLNIGPPKGDGCFSFYLMCAKRLQSIKKAVRQAYGRARKDARRINRCVILGQRAPCGKPFRWPAEKAYTVTQRRTTVSKARLARRVAS